MTDNDGKALGLGTIIAIVVGYAVLVGGVLGLVAANLGLSAAVRGGLMGGTTAALAAILMRRRQKAIGQRPSR